MSRFAVVGEAVGPCNKGFGGENTFLKCCLQFVFFGFEAVAKLVVVKRCQKTCTLVSLKDGLASLA